MDNSPLRRRRFLIGAVGASALLAGCSDRTADEHTIADGLLSDRPSEGEYDDKLYHASDQGITWRWDASGEDWVYFSGQGSSQNPVPGTSHFDAANISRAF